MSKNTIMFTLNPEQLAIWEGVTKKLDGLKDSILNKNDSITESNLAKGIFLVGLDIVLRTANLETNLNKNSEGELLN